MPPENIHDLLYYSSLFIGESAPMATESALLGTPAIFVSTSRRGYTDEIEGKYGLLYTFSDSHDAQKKALEKAIELLDDDKSKIKLQDRRNKLLNEKVDVVTFLEELIKNYPELK